MKTIVISCEMVQEELEAAAKRAGIEPEIIWLEKGLHSKPEKLHGRLQEELDGNHGSDRIILAFGDCGNATLGLRTGNFELIRPRVDDCISLLLGSVKRRMEINAESGSFFLTKGWLNKDNAFHDRNRVLEEYGEDVGQEIVKMMFGHYERFVLLDTGAYDLAPAVEEAQYMAGEMGWYLDVVPAGVDYLSDLLTGPWDDERFSIIPPNSVIESRPYY